MGMTNLSTWTVGAWNSPKTKVIVGKILQKLDSEKPVSYHLVPSISVWDKVKYPYFSHKGGLANDHVARLLETRRSATELALPYPL
jgi:hypothetical protein